MTVSIVQRLLRWGFLALALLFTALLALPNAMLHRAPASLAPGDRDRELGIVSQLRFVRAAIDRGAAYDMQRLYPEGYFFLHVLHGLAWSELALGSTDTALWREATEQSSHALAAIESSEGLQVFQPDIEPSLGVAYLGWTCFLRERILQLQGAHPDSALLGRTTRDLDRVASVYDTTLSPFQQSYRGMVWPGDNVVPVAAMGLHDRIHQDGRYSAVVKRWVAKARGHLEARSGMLPFELEHPSGRVVHPVRGSGQTLLLRFLPFVDRDFAREQYECFRSTFLERRLGLVLVREFPEGARGEADYDSGPVIWDIGASATIVSLGTARQHGDTAVAQALERSIAFYGLPFDRDGQRIHALGLMPVVDAFLAWSKVALPDPQLVAAHPRRFGSLWFLPIHLVSLGLAIAAWLPWFFLRRRHLKSLRSR
ncbi:MAG: hypothetical protein RL318_526 [Fibrobacterota bacterium]